MTLSRQFLRVALCAALTLFIGLATSQTSNAQSKNRASAKASEQVFDLSDFAAAGDGVTDDGPAFQRALDAIATAGGGGTLFVPAGHYFIATPVIKDFSAIDGATLKIQGVPSDIMPAPPTATGSELSADLNLTSEIIPATGAVVNALTLNNLSQLTVEHLGFAGRDGVISDAFITLSMNNISQATIYHCEFYGISTFGTVPDLGGGNVIRAVNSNLSIQQTSILGCSANSGVYAPIVENLSWKGFSISNSVFVDFGQRLLFSKLGLGAPLSWINFGGVAPRTPASSRREAVIRDTFLDEGGWVGITAYPQRWGIFIDPIDLIYISGLKMNVSNLGTFGHQFYDVSNVLIENSFYGWSHNSGGAVDLNTSRHAIFDQVTCVAEADRIRADNTTDRLTVINSQFDALDSAAATTTVLVTAPEDDPVQYVRQQFVSTLGREPDPASHFYWSDLLIRCGSDQTCLQTQRDDLSSYLASGPQSDFTLTGTITDENGDPVSGVTVNLTGPKTLSGSTDAQGAVHFVGLSTSGIYTLAVNDRRYTFTTSSETLTHPAHDVNVVFNGRLNRYTIGGRISKADGTGVSGVTVMLGESSSLTATTDANGNYSFPNLAAGEDYTITPTSDDSVFFPSESSHDDLFADASSNFVMKLKPELLTVDDSTDALVFDSVSFILQPTSVFDSLGFSSDGLNRVTMFAKNLEGNNDKSQYSVVAHDAGGNMYPLDVEFVGDVPNQSWLKQINVKLSPDLSGKCVRLLLSVGGLNSNTSAPMCLNAASSP